MRARLAIILTVLACGALPASALAAPSQDVSSTHTALVASYKALHAVVSTWPTVEAGMRKLDQRLGAECPRVGAGSPQSESEQKLSYEVAGALWATAYHTDAKIARAFIKKVGPLRWTDRAFTRSARKFITGLREMIALQVPDLCGDVRAWTASGYQTVPSSALQFDRHVEAIEVAIPSARRIAKYVQPADRRLLARVEHLDTRFEELEFTTGQRYWNTLLETLALNQ